jgi:hypothetical protein
MQINAKFSWMQPRLLFNTAALALALPILAATALAQEPSSIWPWGYDEHGQVQNTPSGTGYVRVSGGWGHSLALRADGVIETWGNNWYGQCTITGLNADFVEIAAGQYHSLGLKSNGSIETWGMAGVPGVNSGFQKIAGGYWFNLGLKTDGSIVAWGQNNVGQCAVPFPNANFTEVSAGANHSLGLKSDGSVVAWGLNDEGQCTVPVPNAGFVAVAAGGNGGWNGGHSLGLKANGSIVAWGDNGAGQCTVPEPNTGFVAIAAGAWHSLGLKANGTIVAWGLVSQGQCTIPQPNTGFTRIAAGAFHGLAINAAQRILPTSAHVGPGFVVSGAPAGLNTTNDDYYVLGPGIVFSSSQSPIVLTVTYTLASSNPGTLVAVVESKAQQGNTRQTIEVLDFDTQSYDLLNQQVLPMTSPDTVVTLPLTPANHIGPGNEVRLRISYKTIGPVFAYPWRVLLDETTLRYAP